MKDDILHESGSGGLIAYLIIVDPDSVFVPDTQDISSISNSNLFNGHKEINLVETNLQHVKSIQEDILLVTSKNIMNEINSLKKSQTDVESKLCLLEGAQSGFSRNFKW